MNVVVCNYEKDVAGYTVKTATDPRTENGIIIYRLPKNVITQLDLIARWEKKTGPTMEKTYISEEEIIKLSQCKILCIIFPKLLTFSIYFEKSKINISH